MSPKKMIASKKTDPQVDNSIVAGNAQMTPQVLPDTAAQILPAGKRTASTLDPKDLVLQEDLAGLLGDDIGAGQEQRVLLAQAQPGVTSDGIGAGQAERVLLAQADVPPDAGSSSVGPPPVPALLVLGGLGLIAGAVAVSRGRNDSTFVPPPAAADTTAPTVLSVTASTANGSYKAGDTISTRTKV